jgi:superfamily I DNA and RNA helicase
MGQKLQNDRGYDLLGNLVFTEGDVLMESVYRFKGQAAPCVIFTEIDFEALDDLAMRKLFVGVTRATIKLTMILSERSAQKLIERLTDNDAVV